MKKVLFVVLIGFATLKINAQTEKGKFLIGASSSSLGFSSLKSERKPGRVGGVDSDNGETTSLNLTLEGAYFLYDNMALGLQIPFEFYSYRDSEDYKQKNKTIVVSSFFRGYLYDIGNIKPYVEGVVGFGHSTTEINLSTRNTLDGDIYFENEASIFQYEINGGISFFISSKTSFDLQLGYIYTSTENKEVKDISKGFQSSVGLSIFL